MLISFLPKPKKSSIPFVGENKIGFRVYPGCIRMTQNVNIALRTKILDPLRLSNVTPQKTVIILTKQAGYHVDTINWAFSAVL